MGNSGSISIDKKNNGIFEVNVKDYPNYPIAYLRLCKDKNTGKYCMAQECAKDKDDKFLKRKILVVGFRIKDEIYEQVFYLSSGLNSIETLEKFLKTKLKVPEDIDNSELGLQLWIPFSGFGYNKNDIKVKTDLYDGIKLLKDTFNCMEEGKDCLYGRFGRYDPNLMQISYCLGGKFWDNNIDKFKKFKIVEMPTLYEYIKNIPCYTSSESFDNIIECMRYLNDYIAFALPQNYSSYHIKLKKDAMKNYENKKWFDPDIMYDLRIIDKLKNTPLFGYLKINGNYILSPLPLETFTYYSLNWIGYYNTINNIYSKDIKFYNEYILPIIQSQKVILQEEKEVSAEEKKGTFENPYSKREEASIGQYYLKGNKPVQKRK